MARIPALDALRGLAILMIVFANIKYMANGLDLGFLTVLDPWQSSSERLWDVLTMALVHGKFRSLLLLLFGAGLAVQYLRRANEGEWPGGHLRRYAWLFLFGLAHIIFLWDGDILMMYSLAGVLSLAVLPMSQNQLLKWIKGLSWTLGPICLLIVAACAFLNFVPPDELNSWVQDYAKEVGGSSAAFISGSYLDQVLYRLSLLPSSLFLTPLLMIPLAPLPLLGIWYLRDGFFSNTPEGREKRKKVMAWGLGLGVLLNFLALICLMTPTTIAALAWVEAIGGPLLSVGLLAMGSELWLHKNRAQVWFAVVGQMAMSAYIFQSLAASVVYYSWGFKQFGKLTPAGNLMVALGISLLTWSFCALWSRFIGQGPLEALWRRCVSSPGVTSSRQK